MDNQENNTQEFTPQDGGYTQAPGGQGGFQNNSGQPDGGYQSSGQYNGQPNGGYQSSGQYNGQQNAPFQPSGQYNGQPYAGQYVPKQNEPKGFAIAGMVLGIVSIVCCCSPAFGGITGILGLIFSILVLVQKKPGKGMAIAGVICAAIGLLLAVCMYFANNSMLEYIENQGGMNAIINQIENGQGYY